MLLHGGQKVCEFRVSRMKTVEARYWSNMSHDNFFFSSPILKAKYWSEDFLNGTFHNVLLQDESEYVKKIDRKLIVFEIIFL